MLDLSLPASQLLAKSEFPNGLIVFNRLALCGIDPALNLCSKAALEAAAPAVACASPEAGVLGPKGLAEGVARLELELDLERDPLRELMGGKRDGTVPARVRRAEFGEEFGAEPAVAWPASKSGKLSLPGDSGIVSRSGVEWPLPVVGGPQI